MAEPATRRGRESKARIVAAAAGLMYERGVAATSVDDVLVASGSGKGQFYHYFSNKEDLVAEVLRHQLAMILEQQSRFRLDTWDGIDEWFDAMVRWHQRPGRFRGCPLGSIAGEVVEHGDRLRGLAADTFARWESQLADGLQVMQANGSLRDDADVRALAESTIATVQGGYLLSSLKRQPRPMRNALAAARRDLASYST